MSSSEQQRQSDLRAKVEFVESQGWPPACKCGCGEPVPAGRKPPGWNKYANRSHANGAKYKLVKRNRSRSSVISHCVFWGDSFTAACKCGCGEPVPFSNAGPQKFVNRAHQQWFTAGTLIDCTWERQRRLREENIPIEKFSAAVFKMREAKGWSTNEMSVKGGYTPGWLNSRIYNKKARYIRRETAENFLRRLSGMAAPSTPYQRKLAHEADLARARAERELVEL